MTEESLRAAMSAPIKPYELDEACTTDCWPLPPVKPWEPAPQSLLDRMARLWDSWWGMWL